MLFTASMFCNAQDILQEYIRQGVENNLALKQKETNYRKNVEALKEARGLFYPALTFNARYTVSEGGRVIEFPVGDLLNPVYATLNQLTASNQFPQLENIEFPFLRPKEHDTRLRLVQPVFNTDLYYNARIRKEQTLADAISVSQYRRELVTEIKKAYYTVGMCRSLLEVFKQTRLLLQENVRVNQRLVGNDKATRDNLFRSQTELSKMEQQLQEAIKNKLTAEAYFNFLLNKPLQDSIILDVPGELPRLPGGDDQYMQQAVDNREELKNLEQYASISELQVKRRQRAGLPDLVLVADYGYQGEKYQFNRDQDYMQASVVLNWDLSSGLQNRARIREALAQKDLLDQQLEETRNRIALQVISALGTLQASEAGLVAAENQVISAREAFRLVNRKYGEGQASLIEFMDARNAMTLAEENLVISRFNYLSDYAEFETVIAVENP